MAWKIHICKNTIEKYNAGEYEQVVGGGIAWYGKENHTSDKSICEKYSWWMLAGGHGVVWWGHGVVAWYGGGHGCGGHGGPNRKDAGRKRLGSSTVLTNSIFGFSNIYDS